MFLQCMIHSTVEIATKVIDIPGAVTVGWQHGREPAMGPLELLMGS